MCVQQIKCGNRETNNKEGKEIFHFITDETDGNIMVMPTYFILKNIDGTHSEFTKMYNSRFFSLPFHFF